MRFGLRVGFGFGFGLDWGMDGWMDTEDRRAAGNRTGTESESGQDHIDNRAGLKVSK
jgi:hypothetical protein